jgi:SCP-2 sterol transfer family
MSPAEDENPAADLAALVHDRSDQEIEDYGREAGFRTVVHEVATGFAAAFRPERAGDRSAVVQWNVRTPDGVIPFHIAVSAGRCDVVTEAHPMPRLTLAYGFADFLRSMAGRLDESRAFSAGRLRIRGDLGLADAMGRWFEQGGEAAR